jgi:hypothetical protein
VKGYQLGKGEYIEIEPRRLRASRSKMRPFPADLRRMWPISSRVDKPENRSNLRGRCRFDRLDNGRIVAAARAANKRARAAYLPNLGTWFGASSGGGPKTDTAPKRKPRRAGASRKEKAPREEHMSRRSDTIPKHKSRKARIAEAPRPAVWVLRRAGTCHDPPSGRSWPTDQRRTCRLVRLSCNHPCPILFFSACCSCREASG